MKKVLILLAVVFVSFPTMAKDGDTFTEKINDDLEMSFRILSEAAGTCELQSIKRRSTVESLSVPATVRGYTVRKIGKHVVSYKDELFSITLPATLTEIGEGAFQYCDELTSINIPYGVTTIGPSAFSCCYALVDIKLPATVNSIDKYAFQGCKKLQSINLPEGITEIAIGTFYGCESLKHIDYPSTLTKIGGAAFSYTSMEAAIIPEGIETIEGQAFASCKGLQEISIPSTATSIANNAFDASPLVMKATVNCPDIGTWMKGLEVLKEITFGPAVRTIASEAFMNCNLQEVELPEGVTSIGNYAFETNPHLTKLTIPSTVTEIGKGILNSCPSMETLVVKCPTIPDGAFSESYYDQDHPFKNLFLDGVKVIGNSAFYNCNSLEEIDWGTTITEIGENAFSDCEKIYQVSLPTTLEKLGAGCFSLCTGLLSVNLPPTIAEIPNNAFDYCVRLPEIVIPRSVTVIGGGAFEKCAALTEVVIPEGVTHVWHDAFEDCTSLTTVSFPSTLEYVGGWAFKGDEQLTDVYCYMTNPTTNGSTWDVFERSVQKTATLHIPSGTTGLYAGVYPWKSFVNKVEMHGNGDVDGDGVAGREDYYMIKDFILGNAAEGFNEEAADVNGDKKVNVADMVIIRNWILQREREEQAASK